MSTTSQTPIEPTIPGSAAAPLAGAASAGPPGLASSAGSLHAAQEDLPNFKYLDPNWYKEGVPDTKFYKDYPLDAWGQEAAPNARVWKIYRDEFTAADTATLKSWNETLDVLLIFAGLFSAVSTAFIIESYKSLQPDYTQYIANFLYTAATSSSAVNGFAMLPIVSTLGPPDRFVNPSATQRWTNGLWFSSLVINLTVALLCILIKQWLDQYRARTTRSAPSLRAWARRHQIYYPGLNRWRVPTLISLLPLLLHVSLFLFFAGLVLFLRPLDGAIANTLLAILILTLLFYVLSLVLPALFIDCPSYTPLLAQARSLITFGLWVIVYLSRRIWRCIPYSRNAVITRINRAAADDVLRDLLERSKRRFARETSAIDERQFALDGRALSTLLVSTNDPDVIDAGVEAIGAISAVPTLESVARDVPIDVIYDRTLRDSLHTGATSSAFAVLTDARRVRSMWALHGTRRFRWSNPMVDLYPFFGLDGMMVQLMAVHPHYDRDSFVAAVASLQQRLSAHVLEVLRQTESSGPTPSETHRQPTSALDRATCLTFLDWMSGGRIELGEHHVSCILLTFCAGNFAEAESYERTRAMQIVHTALTDAEVPSKDDNGVAINTLDCLFAMLATREGFLGNDETARVFAHHLGLLSRSIFRSMPTTQWVQLTGFAAFVQLPDFQRYISRADLEGYMTLLCCVATPSCDETGLFLQCWTCVATVLKLSCDFGLPSDISQWGGRSLVWRVERVCGDPKTVLPLLDHSFDTVLLKLLQMAIVVGSRIENFVDYWDNLGCMFATLLCRRQRLQFSDEGLIDCLFTDSLLTNQFRKLIRFHVIYQYQKALTTLAKHCTRLSPDGMQRICNELKNPPDGGRALAEDELAFVGRIRRGSQPGGEFTKECDASCDCMSQPHWVQPPAEPTTRTTRWRNRILGRIPPASHSASSV